MPLMTIMAWYVIIGVLASTGAIFLTRRYVPVKHEATVYGLSLTVIAAFYLACAAYFGARGAWRLEATGILVFAAMGCIGTRVPFVLVAGYALHGAWDLMHELQAHARMDLFGGREATPIPLAYGAFCATFDWIVAAYFISRRRDWISAWRSRA